MAARPPGAPERPARPSGDQPHRLATSGTGALPVATGAAAARRPLASGALPAPGCAAASRTRPRRTELSDLSTPGARRIARLHAVAAWPAVGVPHADESAPRGLSRAYLEWPQIPAGGRATGRPRHAAITPRRAGRLHALGLVARVEVGVRVVVEVELASLAAEVVRRPVVLARQGRRRRVDFHPADRVDRDRHDASSWGAAGHEPGTPREYSGGAAARVGRA